MESNINLPNKIKRKRSIFSVITMFFAGIMANLIDIALDPRIISYGPSGVIYGFAGIVIAFILINFVSVKINLEIFKKRKEHEKEFSSFLVNLVLLIIMIPFISLYSNLFLSKGPGINFAVHSITFLLGLFLTLSYYLLMHFKSKDF